MTSKLNILENSNNNAEKSFQREPATEDKTRNRWNTQQNVENYNSLTIFEVPPSLLLDVGCQ